MILGYGKQRCACTKSDTETLVRPLLRSACCLMNMVDDATGITFLRLMQCICSGFGLSAFVYPRRSPAIKRMPWAKITVRGLRNGRIKLLYQNMELKYIELEKIPRKQELATRSA